MNEEDNIELHKMVKEMLDTEDKEFTETQINFLDQMFDKKNFTKQEASKIEQIYKTKM